MSNGIPIKERIAILETVAKDNQGEICGTKKKIDDLDTKLTGKIDALDLKLTGKIEKLNDNFNSRPTWFITGICSLCVALIIFIVTGR